MKKLKIQFIDTFNSSPEEYAPIPAKKMLPEWYKKTHPYIPSMPERINSDASVNATIKKCMPVFDSLTTGYYIRTINDFYISNNEERGTKWYSWPNHKMVEFHAAEQAGEFPIKEFYKDLIPKIENPWGIKTPKGYSCLFINPLNHSKEDRPFTIFEGVVDTDTYHEGVKFPFLLEDYNFVGVIPAGTIIAQVIPFKRDKWVSSIGKDADLGHIARNNIDILKSTFVHGYKNNFWQKKDFS